MLETTSSGEYEYSDAERAIAERVPELTPTMADLKAWMPSAWRICLCPLGMTPLIPMVADEHIKHRAIWFLLAMGGFLWAMVWAQEDGCKRKRSAHDGR